MVIGPPSSKATLGVEKGGNSPSLSEMNSEITVVLVKVNPGNWLIIGVVSGIAAPPGNVSNVMVSA